MTERPGRTALFLVLVCAAATLLAGCGRRETPAEAGIATQTLLVGNSAEPDELDPDLAVIWPDANIDYALFEALTWIDDRTGKPIPAAASNWDVSPDGLVYTFHLRPTGRWSNGDPVTARDFAYGFRRILTPSFAAIYSYMLWPIRNARAYNEGKLRDFSQVGVKVLNPLTLQITLEHPTPYLPALVAHQTWLPVPQATVEKFGRFDQRGTKWTRPGNLVGNGPFVLKEWIPNGRVVVEKNPLYWNADRVRLHRIEYYPIESADAEELAFRAGQLDVTYRLPMTSVPRFRQEHPEELRIDPTLSTFYLFFNVRRPPLNNAKLRRALSLAIDRDAIARDVFFGAEEPAHTFTPPHCGGYNARAAVPCDFAAARKLLAEAGYPGGRGLPVLPAISYQQAEALKIMEAIQAEWARNLGVRMTITSQEFKTAIQNQEDGNYTIAFSGWIADYPDPSTFLNMMVTGGGNNYAGWSDAAYDRLIKASEQTGDENARFEDFQKAEAVLLDSAPVAPLYYQDQVYLIRPFVRAYYPSPIDFHRWTDVYLQR